MSHFTGHYPSGKSSAFPSAHVVLRSPLLGFRLKVCVQPLSLSPLFPPNKSSQCPCPTPHSRAPLYPGLCFSCHSSTSNPFIIPPFTVHLSRHPYMHPCIHAPINPLSIYPPSSHPYTHHPSIHPSTIYISIHSSNHPSIYSTIPPSLHPFIHLYIHAPIYPSSRYSSTHHPSIHLYTHHPSIHPSTIYLCIQPSLCHPSIHPSNNQY